MTHFIRNLSQGCEGTYKILACCCGHNRYPMSIIAMSPRGTIFEMFSNKDIPRKRKFYVRDLNGYYYIPEMFDKGDKVIPKKDIGVSKTKVRFTIKKMKK